MERLRALAALAALLATTATARADDGAGSGEMCTEPHDVDRYQLLRRLSLDLRGRPPAMDEYEALHELSTVPTEVVQSYLESDDFRDAMRRYHADALWPNVTNTSLHRQEVSIKSKGGAPMQITAGGRSKRYRGENDATCSKQLEQTAFDPAHPGEFRPIDVPITEGVAKEGWREVAPYWAPGTKVKVCAYDAQETVKSDDGAPCNSPEGRQAKECGCGPGLAYCYTQEADSALFADMRTQLDLAVDDVTRAGGGPYTDLLVSTKAWENGRIGFWRKNLTPNTEPNATFNVTAAGEETAKADWLDESWTSVDREGLHAGVTTLPIYLLRFQTNRGRANRFRAAFQCEYFSPAEIEDPEVAGCDPEASDLTKRCTCRHCHEQLEPLAASFGLFAEAGSTLMSDTSLFPAFDASCKGAKNNQGLCKRFYVTEPTEHNAGALRAYQWADDHPELTAIIESGPRTLAESAIDDGSFARCTVRRAFQHFVKRDMRIDGDTKDEVTLLEELTDGFVGTAYDFPQLVQTLVSLPQYRRAR
jgi:hypothetical protein